MFGELGVQPEDNNGEAGSLFKEVNKLRKGGDEEDEKAQEAREREKLNKTIFAELSVNKKFEMLTLGFIVINAGFIGYDADYSARFQKPEELYDKDTPLIFPIMENIFCVYFTFEVIIRFLAFKNKCSAFVDSWWVFDSTLVAFMVVETWILPVIGASGPLSQLSVLRLLRLARITRMAKLMRYFPELQIIVKGMVASVRSVGSTAILLVVALYVWAILFTSEYHQGNLEDDEVEDALGGEAPELLFGSMGKSMRSLFIMGTILDDITACTNSIRSDKKGGKWIPMLIAFILFVLISSFTILNMLIGILCEVVGATGEGERAKNLEQRVRIAINQLFEQMDKDKNGKITREEFLSMRRHKNVMDALKDLDIKQKHFDMYADLLFKPEEEGAPAPTFDWEKTINMIMRLRPGTTVSALDFASFQMAVFKNHENMKQHIAKIERMCCKLTAQEQPVSTSGTPQKSASPASPEKRTEAGATLAVESLSSAGTVGDPPALDHTSTHDIVAELHRRLGMGCLNLPTDAANGGRPEQISPSKVMEAFETLGVPQPEADTEAWSKEIFTC